MFIELQNGPIGDILLVIPMFLRLSFIRMGRIQLTRYSAMFFFPNLSSFTFSPFSYSKIMYLPFLNKQFVTLEYWLPWHHNTSGDVIIVAMSSQCLQYMQINRSPHKAFPRANLFSGTSSIVALNSYQKTVYSVKHMWCMGRYHLLQGGMSFKKYKVK